LKMPRDAKGGDDGGDDDDDDGVGLCVRDS